MQPALDGPVDDGGDLRSQYARLLFARPRTRVLMGTGALAGGVVGLAIGGPGLGLVGVGGALLLGALVVILVASSRSQDAFFEHYAAERSMTCESGRLRLPTTTPLLQKGDDRYAARVLEGDLGMGCGGLIALLTVEEHASDGSGGTRQTSTSDFTLGLTEVPESVPLVPELYCRRRSGPRILDWLEASEHPMQPVALESTELAENYEILVSEYQDPNFMRQLFSPTYIVWLTESAPERFSFELFGGRLCCYVPSHRTTAAALDEIRDATAAVATRIREEVSE